MTTEGAEQSKRISPLKEDLRRSPGEFFEWVLDPQDEVLQLRDKLDTAESILSSVADCGALDLGCIYDTEKNHPGTAERALELKEELGSMNSGNFVMAVKDQALSEVEEGIAREDAESFRDMIVDDNYVAWGGIAAYGGLRRGGQRREPREAGALRQLHRRLAHQGNVPRRVPRCLEGQRRRAPPTSQS